MIVYGFEVVLQVVIELSNARLVVAAQLDLRTMIVRSSAKQPENVSTSTNMTLVNLFGVIVKK